MIKLKILWEKIRLLWVIWVNCSKNWRFWIVILLGKLGNWGKLKIQELCSRGKSKIYKYRWNSMSKNRVIKKDLAIQA